MENKTNKELLAALESVDSLNMLQNQKRPVQNGIIWSESVAQFIFDIYPDILESNMDMADLIRIINGKIEQ